MKKQINPTIRAHLIRGAFYLLLLFALCVIPFAFGRRATSTQSGTLLAFFRAEAATNVSQRTLTFAERVAYQRLSTKFTGAIGSGPRSVPIASHRSMQ